MTTHAIRQKIAEYIHFADEKKVKAIYSLLEESINQKKRNLDKGIFARDAKTCHRY